MVGVKGWDQRAKILIIIGDHEKGKEDIKQKISEGNRECFANT